MNTDVLKNLSYGVYVVSTCDDTKSTGCIVNSIMQVSKDTLALSVNHQNYTNQCIKKHQKFAVSILSQDVDDNIIPIFGFQSGKDCDKFKDIEKINIQGIDIIKNSIGYLICETINSLETESHTLFLAKILDGDIIEPKTPMTYAYYHEVKKGKSPKTAPTYIEEKIDTTELVYRCKICGYLYKGDITKEPDSYICPICKKPKEFFEKV
ncbi:flavin reductase [bacterium]|nr:flavin reductase [bacterium]